MLDLSVHMALLACSDYSAIGQTKSIVHSKAVRRKDLPTTIAIFKVDIPYCEDADPISKFRRMRKTHVRELGKTAGQISHPTVRLCSIDTTSDSMLHTPENLAASQHHW